jgi:serine/threonine protein kinase
VAKPAVRTFGKYQILERIATGGMAEIYKARLEGIGGFQRTFAIKRILPHLSANNEYVAMLVDEAKVAGLLSHANIVQILDLGQVDGMWYIAMEFVNGYDLGGVLRRASVRGLRLPVPHCCFLAIELLKGLEYAHQRQVMRGGRPVPLNIIHRDVSPPNILLSRQGEVKLTDFGIARASLKAMETQAGVIKGRFDYMSPEQAAGAKDLDQRSDLFSAGVVLYEALCGEHPFRTDSELTTLERVREGNFRPVREANPEVPPALEAIVEKALCVDRRERFPTATAFKEALDKFFHESGFLFTHATLSTYLKSLFPEHSKGMTPPTLERINEPPTAVETDVDTSVSQRSLRRRPSSEDSLSKGQRVPAFGVQVSEEATQIRQNPLLETREQEEEAQQETIIRESVVPADETPLPSAIETQDPETSLGRLLDRAGTADFDTIETTDRHPQGRGALLALVASAAMFAGTLLGGTLGGSAAWIVLQDDAAAHQSIPALRVQAPKGAAVALDGRPITGEVSLVAGERYELQVTLEGYEPYEQTVTLADGEHRVIILMASEMKSAP